MGSKTSIAWCHATFNPWWGCTKVAAGCTHCYAEAFAKRTGKTKWGDQGTRVLTSDANWKLPLKWNKAAEKEGVRHRVFCASMADVFEDWQGKILHHNGQVAYMADLSNELVTMDAVRERLFSLIDRTPHLDWLLLTKRPENICRMWPHFETDVEVLTMAQHRKNVWLLTSVAEQADAERNIPELLKCRHLSPVLGLSCEPLVGLLDLCSWLGCEPDRDGSWRVKSDLPMDPEIDWIIVGGESGHGARPCNLEWVRSIVDQCKATSVPVFVKQDSGKKPGLRGRLPDDLWSNKEFPNGV